MCVIYGCDTGVPDERQLELSEGCNPDGAGVAWIERGTDDAPVGVRWVKGLDWKGVHQTLQSAGVDLPLMIHFRAASIGGKDKALTHPFPVTKDASLDLEGIAPAALMHNGHWSEWHQALFWSLLTSGNKAPRGVMSDSRAIALIVAHQGYPMLNFFPSGSGRQALLTIENLFIYGEGWTYHKEKGYHQSSTVFQGKTRASRGVLTINPRDWDPREDQETWWNKRGVSGDA